MPFPSVNVRVERTKITEIEMAEVTEAPEKTKHGGAEERRALVAPALRAAGAEGSRKITSARVRRPLEPGLDQ